MPSFSRRDWDHFQHIRSAGVIYGRGREVSDPVERRPVSKRVCAKDLAFLRSVFKWTTEWRHPASRQFLLDVDPTRGLVLPREKSPRRPVVISQAPDPEALERVVTERRKLREVAES